MKFEFMTTSDAYDYTIKFLCDNLDVSKSGFYKWKKARGGRGEKERREYELVRKIVRAYEASADA